MDETKGKVKEYPIIKSNPNAGGIIEIFGVKYSYQFFRMFAFPKRGILYSIERKKGIIDIKEIIGIDKAVKYFNKG